jgi:hypothetical protein
MADSKTKYPTAASVKAHRSGMGDTSAATLAKLKAEVAAQKVTDTKAAIDKLTKEGLAYADAMETALTKLKDTQKQLDKVTVISYRQTGTTVTFTVKASDVSKLSKSGVGNTGAIYTHNLSNVYSGSYILGPHVVTSISGANVAVTVSTSNTISPVTIAGQMYLAPPGVGDPLSVVTNLGTQWSKYDAAVTKWVNSDKLQALTGKYTKLVVPTPNGSSSSSDNGTHTGNITPDNGPVEYNVPSVKSAYFRSDESTTVLLTDSGSPADAATVTKASELWQGSNSGAHKGMFQTYTYWNMNANDRKSTKGTDPGLPSWYNTAYQKQKYGFQFLYNPSEVNMDWGGMPNIDPGLMMSGKDATPFIVPQASASNISFNIILNRMPDLGILNTYGPQYVSDNLEKFYGTVAPAASGKRDIVDDLIAIRELGTMYDIEYLLSTLVGFRTYSDLRSRWTSDMGFLMGLPVELHLGKGLRYLGTINYLSLTHTIFGKGMVPLFTNVQIGFARRIEPSKENLVDKNGKRIGTTNGSLTPNLTNSSAVAAATLQRVQQYKSKNGGSL